ncbi:MAG: diaminopimelate decarboxylase [Terriglobales bacterium]
MSRKSGRSSSGMFQARPPAFDYIDGELHCEGVSIASLEKKFSTPLYIYSENLIRDRYRAFDAAFSGVPHTICYSVKANSNLSLLKLLAQMGAGFDVVSGGELQRVLRSSSRTPRPSSRAPRTSSLAPLPVVFSGVGKTAEEMDLALHSDILMFNVESEQELLLLGQRAMHLRREARVALRVNPDVEAKTHPYISTGLHKHKFGIPMKTARAVYAAAAHHPWLDVAGVSVHIGSQITDVKPFGEAMSRVADLVNDLAHDGHHLRYVDAGGGLGISYEAGKLDAFPAQVKRYASVVKRALKGLDVHLLLEPGRAIVGPAGALITCALYHKRNNGKQFLVVDAAMNDLIRPALYGAYHEIVPVLVSSSLTPHASTLDVVGPICETGDFFARDRHMPNVADGDLLAILDTGAYGMSITSNYNTRPRPAEVLVDGKKARLIRKRETFNDLILNEM